MTKRHLRAWARTGLAALLAGAMLAAMAPAGCARIDVRIGEGGSAVAQAPCEIDKGQAIRIAKALAKAEGVDVERYDVCALRAGKAWWVNFDEKKDTGSPGWPGHFAVRVGQDGKATLFKGS